MLAWAAQRDRILLTHDIKTIPKYAYERVAAGLQMSGIIVIPESMPLGIGIEPMNKGFAVLAKLFALVRPGLLVSIFVSVLGISSSCVIA